MDVFLTRRQLLMAGLESAYGTDAAPQHTSSYQAIRMIDPFALDLGTEMVEVQAGALTRGMSRPIATVRPAGITFRTFVQGTAAVSYTASVKPPIGDLLRACGLQETFAAAVYTYAPATDVGSDRSVTIVAHQDGYEHRILGCQGNVNFIFKAGEPVVAEFNFRGMLSTEANTTRAAPTGLPSVVPPRWVGSGSVFVESLSADIENANFNTNNTVLEARASRANSATGISKVVITERAPGGSLDPEATEPGTFNFFPIWRSTSGFALRLQTGIDLFNRMSIISSRTVLKTVGWGDKSGMSIFNVDFQAYENSGDDEYQITFS